MSDAETTRPKRSILHPTDFSAASHTAFAHALRIALCGRAKLTLVHVGHRGKGAWTEYPGIRETLARWGIVDRNAGRAEVVELGITASKIELKGGSKVRGVLQRAAKARADLLVLSTHRRSAIGRLLRPSIGLTIARDADVPCLLLPARVRGFVDRRSGEVSLRKVLFPVAPDVDPSWAIREVVSLLDDLKVERSILRFLSVNTEVSVDVPETRHEIELVRREGEVVDIIDEEARTGVDLVVMSSLGHDSTKDTFFGSTTERVAGRVRVPLLVVPGGL